MALMQGGGGRSAMGLIALGILVLCAVVWLLWGIPAVLGLLAGAGIASLLRPGERRQPTRAKPIVKGVALLLAGSLIFAWGLRVSAGGSPTCGTLPMRPSDTCLVDGETRTYDQMLKTDRRVDLMGKFFLISLGSVLILRGGVRLVGGLGRSRRS